MKKTSLLFALTVQLIAGTSGGALAETLMNTTLPLPAGGIQAKSTTKSIKQSPAPVPVVTPNVVAAPATSDAPVLRGLDSTPAATPAPAAPVSADAPTLRGLDTPTATSTPEATPAPTETAPPSEAKTDAPAGRMARMRNMFHRKAAEPTAKPATQVAETTPTAAPVETAPVEAAAPVTAAAVTPSTVAPTADPSDLRDDEKSFTLTTPIKQNAQMALLPSTGAAIDGVHRAGIYIDNDEEVEQQETIKYEELPLDDETKTKVKAGAHFPVVIASEITSRTAKVGDPVQGRLKYDLKIGDRLVAPKGALVRGHLNYALPARTPLHSMVTPKRWYKTSGVLGISFDEIINDKNEHIPLVAEPAQSALYVKNKAEGRVLGINAKGQIAGPWSQQLKYKAVRVGLNAAMAPLGTMSFGAMPLALGVMGAVNPSFAFMKPVGENVRHRRIKGFCWGALSGVPGSWLIEDTTIKGQEAVIKPGDEFLAEFRQEFTGEPATDAEMLGGNDGKVHGEVVGAKDNKLKKQPRGKKQQATRPNTTT